MLDAKTVLANVNILDVVSERVALVKAGKDFKACCPFHDEKTPSFYVSPSKQFFHCFGCAVNGDAIDFIRKFDHIGFRQALESLAISVGIDPDADANAGRHRLQRAHASRLADVEAELVQECGILYLFHASTIDLSQADRNRAHGASRRVAELLAMYDGPNSEDQADAVHTGPIDALRIVWRESLMRSAERRHGASMTRARPARTARPLTPSTAERLAAKAVAEWLRDTRFA